MVVHAATVPHVVVIFTFIYVTVGVNYATTAVYLVLEEPALIQRTILEYQLTFTLTDVSADEPLAFVFQVVFYNHSRPTLDFSRFNNITYPLISNLVIKFFDIV